jgi:drug/metabolite transporter (DMT)-like permease
MTGVSIVLVLGSAFLHATWNARSKDGDDRVVELGIAYANGVVLLSPWLIADPPTEVIGFMVLSGVAHGGYITFLSRAYTRGGLATTYPLARGTAPLLVAMIGVWLLGQTPSAPTIVGALVVAVGLAVIGGVAWGRRERTAILMALITGMFIASYTLLDARGVEQTGELGYFAGASVIAVLVVVGLQRPSVARIRASLRPGITIGVFSTTAYGLILAAYGRADAANVATLRGTSILFGLFLVRRTVTRRLVVGAVAVIVGAALVAV